MIEAQGRCADDDGAVRRFVVLVAREKLVPELGRRWTMPVEVFRRTA
jgi:ribose 5-phosphate isomerase